MEPYHANIEKDTIANDNYRRVVYTVPHSFQLVLMSIPVGGNIHMEKHEKTTQFIRVEKGLGVAIVPDKEHQFALADGVCIVIPPNTFHKIENIGDEPLKLYTIYTPPEHPQNLIQRNEGS